jgi:hypothetical protein
MNILQQMREFWRSGGLSKLASRDHSPVTSWDRIGWWEARRVPYNLIVGCAGMITCTFAVVAAVAADILFTKDFGLPDPPIFGILIVVLYAVAANVCYTGGWIGELVIWKLWPREADKFASRSFVAGLIFSILLTLIPCALIVVTGLLDLIKHYHLVR